MKKLLLLLIIPFLSFGQDSQIVIDGEFNDWENVDSINDPLDFVNNIDMIDFISISITNDNNFLYIKFKASNEFDLIDWPYNLSLFIDTDNDNSTGFLGSDGSDFMAGCELSIQFGQKTILYYNNDSPIGNPLSLYDLGVVCAPTVTSNEFEIAIDLTSNYNGISLFDNSVIGLQLIDWQSGDIIPNDISGLTYTLQDSPLNYPEIIIEKSNSNLIRVTAYNVQENGLITEATDSLQRIIQALNSDIYAFSECGGTSVNNVKNILDLIIPLNTAEGWVVIKKGGDDLILASKYPIIQDWPNESNGIQYMHPCLIDLPDDIYDKDLLIINAHTPCCTTTYLGESADSLRQIASDDFVNFILDAKSEGGIIDLDEGTPFILCGDLNLVGYSQQLTTLLTGEIINTSLFGESGGMDWSNNNLKDQLCLHTEIPFAYTWQEDEIVPGSYPPGRLDFIIFSNDVMSAQKSFSINTEFMSQKSLNLYNLNTFDSYASDHLAITTDFDISLNASGIENFNKEKLLLKGVNLLGKESTNKGFQLHIYDDGSVEKKYLIK